jgi:HSP20 family protein
MVLSRWSPFATLLSAQESFPTPAHRGPVDVQRTDDGYRLQAALPGFEPQDVEVTLERSALTISAKRSEEKRTEQGRYLRREVFSDSFQRRFVLPPEVAPEDVRATLENGVLTIDVRHTPKSDSVRIPVGAPALPERPAQAEQPST